MRIALTALLLISFSTTALADMQASFEWGPTKKCFDSKSPPFKLSGVPTGTAKLDIKMVDTDAMSFDHGGGKVDFKGQQSLPYGAFRYKGPCPPMRHTYRFTVKALDASGKTLATAKASKDFPQ